MRPPSRRSRALTIPLVAALGAAACTAPEAGEQAPNPDLPDRPVTDIDIHAILEKRVAMIPMRDGARLHTEIYVPRDVDEPLPFIIERTPYGLLRDSQGYSTRLYDHPDLIEDRNIMVFQDLRGRFDSEGEFLSLRPPKDPDDPDGIDETTDAWDTIEWLVNNVLESNGRAGILGISYGGFTSIRASHDPHPALRAASPQATCADMFIGDDWHHNGAFRLEYAFNWIARVEGAGRVVDQHDLYEWFLDLGALSNINERYFHGEAPTWNAFAEHPNMDSYWETEMCGVLPFVDEPLIPLLHVLGWYDSEDFYGPLEVYKKLERKDENGWNNLVIGPWTHGGWTFHTGDRMLEFDFGSETGRYYKKEIEAKWFAHWLKDGPAVELPEVMAFRTGANEWETFESWPPPAEQRDIYLHAGRSTSFDPPSTAGASASGVGALASDYDEYISDPWNPVPYRSRPIQWSGWPTWQAEDQRMAHGRPDVLFWESEPLEEDLTMSGDPVAHLFASTSGTASDWVVKLIDVYPDDYEPNANLRGYQYMVAGEVFRGRYRNSYRDPEPIPANEVQEYTIALRDRSHTFKAGHRIMVQVQSTWFPVIDRNPQSWVPNIYEATESDLQMATQRVYRSERYPTRITLPVRR